MKVAICCIGRRENKYVNEFIEHYFNLGVDKIFIYDNNYDYDNEYFEDVIPIDYINNKIEIINYRNLQFCQLKAYQECYDKHKNDFDWFLFIDFDEFLTIGYYNNIKEFLGQEKFNNFSMIHINWMNYGDNDNIYYEDKPLSERFPIPILPLDKNVTYTFPENNHIKSIVRGNLNNVRWISTSHTPIGIQNCCGPDGIACRPNVPFLEYNFTYAYFKHYTTKSLEEFLEIKVERGFPDINKDYYKTTNPIKKYFSINKITDEKIAYLEKINYIF